MKKNSMKKAAALAMSAAMVMSMGAAASAATLNTEKEGAAEETIGIYAYAEQNNTLPVVSVDMSYGAMKFVWRNETTEGIWDPTTHTYVKDANDDGKDEDSYVTGWYPMFGSNTITLTNHSNVKVTYDVKVGEMNKLEQTGSEAGLGMESTTAVQLAYKDKDNETTTEKVLSAGVKGEPINADKHTIIVTLTGKPGEAFTHDDYIKICELTVKLTKFRDDVSDKEI